MIKKIINKIKSPLGKAFLLFYLVLLIHSALFNGVTCSGFLDFGCLITFFLLFASPIFLPLFYFIGFIIEKLLTKITFINNLIIKFQNEPSKKLLLINIFLLGFLFFHIARFIFLGIKYVNRCLFSANNHYCDFEFAIDVKYAIDAYRSSWMIDIINITYVPIIIFFVSIFLLILLNYNKIKYSVLILNILGILLILQVFTLPTENIIEKTYL